MSDWLSQYEDAESASSTIPVDVVASPDVDGVLSIVLLQRWLQRRYNDKFAVRICAIYTTTDLVLLGTDCDSARLKRALWIDHDVLGNCRSIGNHLTQMRPHDRLPWRHGKSFNPNEYAGVAFSNAFRGLGVAERDKYPFGTAHLLAHALFAAELNLFAQKQPYHSIFAWLAHADGAWLTAQMYRPSALIWFRQEFQDAPWMKFLFDDYLHDCIRFDKHNALVKSLSIALRSFLQNSSSASLQSDRFLRSANASHWQVCRGRQGITNANGWDVAQLNCDWLPAFREMLALVQVSFGGKLGNRVLPVANASQVWHGEVHKPNPDDLLEMRVSVPATLKRNNAFSIAFVSRRMLRYTTKINF